MRRISLVFALVLLACGLAVAPRFLVSRTTGTTDFVHFESPHVHPAELTPSGDRLVVVNTPDSRITVFDVSDSIPVRTGEVFVGLEPVSLLYTPFAVIVGLVYVHLPFMVLPLYANLEKHDPALLDAAQDLGANAWQRFWRVTFPLSLPGVYAGAALVFIPALGIFAIPDLLGGTEGIMIGNVIKQQFMDTRDWPFGSVLSMVLTAMAVVLAGLAAWVARRSRT